MNVRLKEKPFFLSDSQADFVLRKLSAMTMEEKIGQLFFPINYLEKEEEIRSFIRRFQPAGILNRPAPGAINQRKHKIMQEEASIPLLIAANVESGGNGAATDGTAFGNPLQVAATGDGRYAWQIGHIAGQESRAIGVNYAFAPVVDIDNNTLNPIMNTRTFGNNAETVCAMASAFIDGLMDGDAPMCYALKHFPGDGVDDRDQHLHTTYNTLSPEAWEASYGKIYRTLIEKGAPTIMVGHIGFPKYVKRIHPKATRKEILCPGSLSKEIVTGLLRGQLGFNGVIITDSTSMNGFYAHMSREIAVPTAIANGCDLFLFNFNVEEDYAFMRKGIENGILSMERVDEAVARVLALKAHMGLFDAAHLVPDETELGVLGSRESLKMARQCAEHAITLVKDEENILPLSPEKHKRILVDVMGDREDFYGNQPVGSQFIHAMRKAGFRWSDSIIPFIFQIHRKRQRAFCNVMMP